MYKYSSLTVPCLPQVPAALVFLYASCVASPQIQNTGHPPLSKVCGSQTHGSASVLTPRRAHLTSGLLGSPLTSLLPCFLVLFSLYLLLTFFSLFQRRTKSVTRSVLLTVRSSHTKQAQNTGAGSCPSRSQTCAQCQEEPLGPSWDSARNGEYTAMTLTSHLDFLGWDGLLIIPLWN